MKRFFWLQLGILLAISLRAQVQVVSPNGGERIPRNLITFRWNAPKYTWGRAYADQYDSTLSRVIQTVDLGRHYMWEDPSSGWAGFFLANWYNGGLGPLDPGIYKWRIVDDHTNTDESDGFFEVAPPAQIVCELLGENPSIWRSNEVKHVRITWQEFDVGDPYVVHLAMKDFYDYPHSHSGNVALLSSGTFESRNGTKVIEVHYPSNATDGIYVITCENPRNYIWGETAPFDIPLAEVRMQIFGNYDYWAVGEGDVRIGMWFIIDARFAPRDVDFVEIPLNVGILGENILLQCALYEHQKSSDEIGLNPFWDKPKRISDEIELTIADSWKAIDVATTRRFKVKRGTSKLIALLCSARQGTGGFQWIYEWFYDPNRKLVILDHKGKPFVVHAWVVWPP